MSASLRSRLKQLEATVALRLGGEDPLADAKSRTGLTGFLDSIRIDSSPEPMYLRDCIRPWQRDLYSLLTPLIERACGFDVAPGPSMAFIVLPRGTGKTSMIAQLAAWGLTYSRRPITAVAAAGDKEQSAILGARLDREVGVNPFIAHRLKRSYYKVRGLRGELTILSSDAPTSSGLTADLIILDELSYHRNRDMYEILASGAAKRPGSALICITNAWLVGSWQWDLYQQAMKDKANWVVYSVDGMPETWMTEDKIAAIRATMHPSVADRLFLNKWQTESGEYLPRYQIERCVDYAWVPQAKASCQSDFCLALDYGAVRDRAAMCVMHIDPRTDEVVLDRMLVHQGSHGSPTPISLVEDWMLAAVKDFRIRELILDPYQLEAVAQKAESLGGITVNRFAYHAASHHRLADNLRTLVVNKKLRLFPNAGKLTLANGSTEDLVDEMSQLVIEEASGSSERYRFNHLPGKHDDRTAALALACLACVQRRRPQAPVISVVSADPSAPFTPLGDPSFDPFAAHPVQLYSDFPVNLQ